MEVLVHIREILWIYVLTERTKKSVKGWHHNLIIIIYYHYSSDNFMH